jgi:choline transport protein
MSWIQGWVTILGWQATIASAIFAISTLIQGLVVLSTPTYEPQRWHTTLMMICMAVMSCIMNTVWKRFLPVFEMLAGVFHV